VARFVRGKPVKTEKPTVTVDAGLPAGVHLFRLQVVTSDGRTSRPDEVKVVITRRGRGPLDGPRPDDGE
jgi:hypothetical protein